MIEGIRREVYQLRGENLESAYNKVNELLGLKLELEIDQEYGTDCYDLFPYSGAGITSPAECIRRMESGSNHPRVIIDYLIGVGELPQADILCSISY